MKTKRFDVRAIESNSWIRSLAYEHSVGSTNTMAAEMVAANKAALPLLVLTDEQTAGRGRGLKSWWSDKDCLTFSLALDRRSLSLQPSSLYPLAVGVALAESIESIAGRADVLLKWPNDLILGERKAAGILLETAGTAASVLIVGIGINVNCDLGASPQAISESATSIAAWSGEIVSEIDLLTNLLQRLEHCFTSQSSAVELLDQYRRRNYLLGRQVSVSSGNQAILGMCVDIDATGAIVLQTENGARVLSSGSVELCQKPRETN